MKPESKLRTTAALLAIACCLAAVSDAASGEPAPSGAIRTEFERHVAPLLSRYGCNAGACHGASEGQGGLKLSLFGSDVNADYAAVADQDSGRIDLDDPEASLLLEKPTLRTDHGGGQHFAADSIAWRTLLRWIKEGAQHEPDSGILRELECVPTSEVLHVDSAEVRLTIFATFADGTREDVTAFCEFRSQNETVACVEGPAVRRVGPGDTHIIAIYRGHSASVAVLSPHTGGSLDLGECRPRNEIDRLILHKLRALNIEPSPLTRDVEFLRRVSLATIGQLPTPDEIRQFTADPRGDKRSRTIDRLLSHPLHASLWATRMCEITGSRDLGAAAARAVDRLREWKWHEWFRQRFSANVPYDQITRDILCATTLEGLDWTRHCRR